MRRGSRALVVGALALVGCRGAEAASRSEGFDEGAVPVRLAKVESGPVARPIRGTGVLKLKSEVDLAFKVGGVVAAVTVEEGARVRRGQVLARLDPTEVDAALRQAREGATKAERDLDRVRRLHASGAIAIVEVQNAETAFALAEAGTNAAAFNAQRSVIVAPDDGRVDRRLVEPGEVVSPGRPVLHMSGNSKGAVVRIGLTDRDALRVAEGDAATVVLDADAAKTHEGKVTQVATVATSGAGTFEVEVKLVAPPAVTLSGLTAKVEIAHREEAGAIVPVGAVTFGPGDESAVFVVEGGRAHRVPVKVAFLDGARVALSTRLSGDVVEAGAPRLKDGTRVRVVP